MAIQSPIRGLEKLRSGPVWQKCREAFFESGDPAPVLDSVTAETDALTLTAFRETLEPAFPTGLAAIAVGGFGRRELFPYSDVDIAFLVDDERQNARLKDPLAEFARLMWDAGLRLSHSVRTVAECAQVQERNIELHISLLDRRLLCGDTRVFDRLEEKLPRFLERQSELLARHLCRMTRERHQRFDNTPHHREPDIKEAPGGLRDLHFSAWLRQLHRGFGGRPEPSAAFLGAARCYLHYQAQRDQNVLKAQAQEELAAQPFSRSASASAWTQEFYRHARLVYTEARRAMESPERSEGSLFSQLREWRSRLSTGEFTVSRERVYLRRPSQLASDPGLVFRLFAFVARHGIAPAADTERRLEQNRAGFAAYCAASPGLWRDFEEILKLPHAALALSVMRDTGMLEALLPEWSRVVGLADAGFHRGSTVDEHALAAARELSSLRATQDPGRRVFAALLEEMRNPAPLLVTLLFQHAGLGEGQEAAAASAERACAALRRLEFPAAEQDEVSFLIEHQPDLASAIQSRDLNNPEVVRALAVRAGTIERLKALTLLTYADLAAAQPAASTPWKIEQLAKAYHAVRRELQQELESERIQAVPENLPAPADFLAGFPVRYLRTHSRAEIEAHARLRELSRPTGAAVSIERSSGAYQATLVARDRPFLFASVTGALSSFGLDIVKAEAFGNARGLVLDTFVFTDPKRTLELNPTEVERLRETIGKAAAGKLDTQKLMQDRRRPAKLKRRTAPSVAFEDCGPATLVEIRTEDRPALLYDLAVVFGLAACNIDVVLIDTEGHKAIDVFYVARDRAPLSPELRASLEKKLLEAC